MRTIVTVLLAVGCGGSQAGAPSPPPPPSTAPAPAADPPPASGAHGDPAARRSPTVIPADKLTWMESPDGPGKAAALWQDGDQLGGLVSVPGDSRVRPVPHGAAEVWIRLSPRLRMELVTKGDPAAPMLACDGAVPCTFYKHPVPPGQQRATSLAWQDYGPDRRFAPVWGDPKAGPFGVIVEIKAGTAPFWHMHGRDVRMVVLAGTVEFGQSGEPNHTLAPGSYVEQAGGYKHSESCHAGADCVVYMHGERGFDVKPM